MKDVFAAIGAVILAATFVFFLVGGMVSTQQLGRAEQKFLARCVETNKYDDCKQQWQREIAP